VIDSKPFSRNDEYGGICRQPRRNCVYDIAWPTVKKGSTWTDTLTNNGIKNFPYLHYKKHRKQYSLHHTFGVISGTTKMEMMGQEVNATMGGKVDGEITVDIKTGALIKEQHCYTNG